MNKPSKIKAEFPSLLQSTENERRDAETLRSLQFALNPLQLEDRAAWTQDGDPAALPGETEAEYNERTDRYGERQ